MILPMACHEFVLMRQRSLYTRAMLNAASAPCVINDVDTRDRITLHTDEALPLGPPLHKISGACMPYFLESAINSFSPTDLDYARTISSLIDHNYVAPRPDPFPLANALRVRLGRSAAGPVGCIGSRTSCEPIYI
jgi:hypothetical protein